MSGPRLLVIDLGDHRRGLPMDLGDGVVVAAGEADRIRDIMAKAAGGIPAEIVEGILTGAAEGARYDVAKDVWTGPPRTLAPAEVDYISGRWVRVGATMKRKRKKDVFARATFPRQPFAVGFQPKLRTR